MAISRELYELKNPLTQYPQPKFKHQPQSVPGL